MRYYNSRQVLTYFILQKCARPQTVCCLEYIITVHIVCNIPEDSSVFIQHGCILTNGCPFYSEESPMGLTPGHVYDTLVDTLGIIVFCSGLAWSVSPVQLVVPDNLKI